MMGSYRGLEHATRDKELGKPTLSRKTEWEFGSMCAKEGEKLKVAPFGLNIPADKETARFVNYILYKMLLEKIGDKLGGEIKSFVDPNDPTKKIEVGNDLNIDTFKQNPKSREILVRTMKTMISATESAPIEKNMGGYSVHINNSELADLIQPTYSAKSPEWAVPEAYQAVTSLEKGQDGKNALKFLVGRNSPLTWAEKELYQACKEYEASL